VSGGAVADVDDGQGHGGHDAPSWSRLLSASVLLGCTFLYAIIAGEECVVP
jgi:Ca2+:H+ antiporter